VIIQAATCGLGCLAGAQLYPAKFWIRLRVGLSCTLQATFLADPIEANPVCMQISRHNTGGNKTSAGVVQGGFLEL
jgi:hypothetical protein